MTPTPRRLVPIHTRTLVLALTLTVAAAPAALAQSPAPSPAPSPAESPRPASSGVSQLFHITLVVASRKPGGGTQESLPKGVAKALDDLRDFLPYKSYRVVDAALVRGTDEAHTWLTGPGGTKYQAEMTFRTEIVGTADASPPSAYLIDRFELRQAPSVPKPAKETRRGGPAVAPLARESNLTASFRIARGETVVVGSSRLDGGDEAMIVLLTAVP